MKCEFDHFAAEYAAYRPAHAPQVFEIIQAQTGPADGRVAMDVGAGSGQFTCGLAEAGWNVIAVDASPVMLSRIPVRRLAIRPVCAPAERLPFRGDSAELITAAQSFHWFNPPYALAEFARVLRVGGWLVLLWYRRRVEGHPFVEAFESLLAEFNPKYRGEFARQDWVDKIGATRAFGGVVKFDVYHDWQIDQAAMVGYGRSLSYVRNTVPRARMPRLEERLREITRMHFGEGPCVIPLQTEIWTARRK